MSYNLHFWHEVVSTGLDPGVICDLVCEHEEPEGMARFSVPRIKALFNQTFPGIQDHGPQLVWEQGNDGFEVAWPFTPTPTETFAFSVTCGDGLLRNRDTITRILGIAGRLGCDVYDPQSGQQYDLPNTPDAHAETCSAV